VMPYARPFMPKPCQSVYFIVIFIPSHVCFDIFDACSDLKKMFFQEAQRGLRAARELVEDLKCQIATMVHSEEKISWEKQKRSWQEERQRLESMILDLNATIERLHISVREIAAERERARETLDLNKSQAQVDSAQREMDRIRSSERR
jgi:hypothetical protein